MEINKIPVTIITGYLGAGKTTLVNKIINENKTHKIAIIENEIGEIPLDGDFIATKENKIYMINDCCLCCSYRDDLVEALENIYQYKDKYDYVIIETTGIADPSPIAMTFIMNSDIKDKFSLNGIITLVDSKTLLKHIMTTPEIKKQISFADLILLTKTDLANDLELRSVIETIRKFNPLTEIKQTIKANINIQEILFLNDKKSEYFSKLLLLEQFFPFSKAYVYELEANTYQLKCETESEIVEQLYILKLDDINNLSKIEKFVSQEFKNPLEDFCYENDILKFNKLNNLYIQNNATFNISIPEYGLYVIFQKYSANNKITFLNGKNFVSEKLSKNYKLSGEHEEDIVTLNIIEEKKLNLEKFNYFLSILLPRYGADLYRYKGILYPDDQHKIYFNGVHEIFEYEIKPLEKDEQKINRLVFIGKNINQDKTLRGLDKCFE
jgi:G3E family GTPase